MKWSKPSRHIKAADVAEIVEVDDIAQGTQFVILFISFVELWRDNFSLAPGQLSKTSCKGKSMVRKAKRRPNRKTAAKPASTRLVVDGFEFHVFIQLNDVYFLDARPDYSKPGGLILPRVATMVGRLREHLPGQVTFCVPGDFLAPSCLGKLTAGEHMVDIFNSLDVDFVTFGNHEFEQPPLTAATLAKNITQSHFTWLCANFSPSDDALAALKQRADKLKPFDTVQLRDGLVAVLFGVTLEDEYRGYGAATDPIEATKAVLQRAREEIPAVKDGTAEPVFIALTHQDAADDVRLARECPELLLMMGGHDHDEEYVIDESRPLIVKATSNARTIRFNVLLHRRRGTEDDQSPVDRETLWSTVRSRILNRVFNTLTHEVAAAAPAAVRELLGPPVGPNTATSRSRQAFIDDTRLRSGIVTIGDYEVGVFSFAISTLAPAVEKGIPEAQVTLARINHWEQHWDRTAGATRTPIVTLPIEFDARDAHVRKRSTNIGNLAADALRFDEQGRQLAPIGILNSGSLRADRVFAKLEPISQRTICDLLFFDNTVFVYTLSGRKLWEILQKSLELRTQGGAEGHGDFLQLSGLKVIWRGSDVTRVIKTDHAHIEEDLLADDTTYEVATTDYVGKISKHYREFFNGAPKRRSAAYNQQFDAAVRRLPVIRRPEDAHAYYLIHNSRWLPADLVQ